MIGRGKLLSRLHCVRLRCSRGNSSRREKEIRGAYLTWMTRDGYLCRRGDQEGLREERSRTGPAFVMQPRLSLLERSGYASTLVGPSASPAEIRGTSEAVGVHLNADLNRRSNRKEGGCCREYSGNELDGCRGPYLRRSMETGLSIITRRLLEERQCLSKDSYISGSNGKNGNADSTRHANDGSRCVYTQSKADQENQGRRTATAGKLPERTMKTRLCATSKYKSVV